MDGTETGWSRPAESAPRWRALLDRALLGGRHDDTAETDERPVGKVAVPEERGPGHGGGNGYHGRASVGYPANVVPPEESSFFAQSGHHDEHEYPAAPRYAPLESGYQHDLGSSRYAALESGYQPDVGSSRYAALESGYQPDVGPSRYAALESDYQPDMSPSRYPTAEPGYPTAGGYDPPEPAAPSPYAALGTGHRAVPVPPAYDAVPASPGPGHPTPPVYPAVPASPGPGHPTPPVYPAVPVPPGYDAAPAPPGPGHPTPPVYPAVPVPPGYDAAPAPPGPPHPTPPVYPAAPAPPGYDAAAVQAGYQSTPVQGDYRVATGYAVAPDHRADPVRQPAYRGSAGVPTVVNRTAEVDPVARSGPGVTERQPGESDPEMERAREIIGRDLGLPRVLAFANPKGGVHKTTATVLAAATIGSVRARGVLAWDDNELRGTLGLRAGSARHARTIRHLIAHLVEVEVLHSTDLTERLDDFLRHASDGSYDVLAGEESSRFAARLDQHTVGRVLELLRRTHDVICVDTGNNVESANWQTVLRAADQLVVTTVPREDAAFAADWMLDLLHEEGMTELAENAVTLLSCPTSERSPLLDDLQRHFATRTRAVAVVPYDPALETGSSIEYQQLLPETRAAWLRAASAMLEPFAP